MIFTLRAPRVRRLTASFGLSLTAAGVALAALAAALSTPTPALAKPSRRHSHATPSSSPNRLHKAMVRVETARLRSSPGDHHTPTALLDAGRSASVVARKGDWAKLRLATGREGWVRADLLSISKKTVRVASASSPAKKHKSSDNEQPNHHKKQAQVAKHPAKQVKRVVVAKAKPKHKYPSPIKVAVRPAIRRIASAPTVSKAKKPVQFAFARPVVRAARMSSHSTAPIVIKTHPVVAESIAVAVVPALTETTAGNTPQLATAQVPESGEATGNVSEIVAPVQRATANTEEKEAPAGVAPAKPAPPVSRSLSRNERIARSALSYRGVPYRMGATGRGAFDCSGFMMYLFDKAGLQLPRTAAEQYLKGMPVSKDQLQPGDLVFFKNTYKHGVSHVGIYIGGGKFCHASSGGHAVRTDNLSKDYYVNHWAGARRAR